MSTGLRFTLEVDGLPPDAFAVVSFHLNQSLSSLFSLDLSLVSQQFLSLEFAQVLDKMAPPPPGWAMKFSTRVFWGRWQGPCWGR
ncbi:TPA: hypothetical protein HIC05_003041 [Escherichia coli]|nr:hypothetical protein [Escherichia coli]